MYFAASASLLVLPRQEAKPGVESDKTKGEKETQERERDENEVFEE